MKMNFIKSKIMVGVSSFLLLCNAFVPLASAVKPLEGFVNQSTHEIVLGRLSEEMKENFCRKFFRPTEELKHSWELFGWSRLSALYEKVVRAYGDGKKYAEDANKFDFYYHGWTPLTWALYQMVECGGFGDAVYWYCCIKHMIKDYGASVCLSADPNAPGYPTKKGRPLPAMSPIEFAAAAPQSAYKMDTIAILLNHMPEKYRVNSLALFSDNPDTVKSAIAFLKHNHGILEVRMIPKVEDGEGKVGELVLEEDCSSDVSFTPLGWAAINNRPEIVEALCAAGADVNALEFSGLYGVKRTLYLAAIRGYSEVVKILCKYKPRLHDCGRARTGEAPAIIGAIKGGHVDVVRELLNNKYRRYEPKDFQGGYYTLYDPDSRIPLLRLAVKNSNVEILKLLIKSGAPVDDLFRHAIIEGNIEVLKWLITEYNVNDVRSDDVNCPLRYAAEREKSLSKDVSRSDATEEAKRKDIEVTVEIIKLLRQAGATGDYSSHATDPEIKRALTEPVEVLQEKTK